MDKSCYINKMEYQTTMKMNNNNNKKKPLQADKMI